MQFYDATNKRALCSEVDRLCDSDDTSYPRLDKTARINDAYEEVIGTIISSDGVWQWDDTNKTDLPVGTGTLVEGQEQYSFSTEYLKVVRMKVKTVGGQWQLLKQLDQQDIDASGLSVEEYFGLQSNGNPKTGLPEYYDILGDGFRLYPAPTATYVTLSSGLKVEFARTATLFTATSTTTADTTEPGLPSPYHVLLAYKAALSYCASYKKDRVTWIMNQIEKLEKKLYAFYTRRNPDRRDVMTMAKHNFI